MLPDLRKDCRISNYDEPEDRFRRPTIADDMGVTGLIRRIAAGIDRFTDYVRGNPTAGFITLAVVIALAALVTIAVQSSTSGPSEAEIEAACWAERQAIAAEMQVWAAMDDGTVKEKAGSYPSVHEVRAARIKALEVTMPFC